MEIPAELEAKIDEAITHYPVFKRSATLPLLHLFQEHFGYITDEAIDWIAKKLELSPINVLELVTFYPMFRREPAGKHHIRVCRTLSCAMAGGYELLDTFCKHAKIDRSHNGHGHILKSADGKYSIEFVECLASCGFGPVCMVNDDFYEAVAQEEVPELLKKYQ
jgi:NADH-quinone oxidoreductase subunit E